LKPFVRDPDFTLYVGDALEVLRGLPDESVHCCVTSPPYWGLRDYGTEGQIGLEPTPEAFVAAMVAVFQEVRRVLRADGTCWLNLGDSYVSDPGKGGSGPGAKQGAHVDYGRERMAQVRDGKAVHGDVLRPYAVEGLRPKNMVGIPWRVAFALQADGWYLRSDIVWSKPNPMPESVTDRPTKAHEYVFLLTRSPRYFFDQEAVREPHLQSWIGRAPVVDLKMNGDRNDGGAMPTTGNPAGRNVRSVWEIATQPYPDAHFATFPEALPERCIKAGTSERGCCPECGDPWKRRIERVGLPRDRGVDGAATIRPDVDPGNASHGRDKISGPKLAAHRAAHPDRDLGWTATCWCFVPEREGPFAPVPCTVLDPFMGSGTTALVARKLGRRSIGIELNPEYAALCADRLKQLSLFAEDAA
jgi:DNA modification methylase